MKSADERGAGSGWTLPQPLCFRNEKGKTKIRRGAGLDGAAPLAFYWLRGDGIVGVIGGVGFLSTGNAHR